MATRKFTPAQINNAISKLPESAQKKIPKVKKSQDVAGLWNILNRTAGSKTGLVIMEMLVGIPSAMKKGGKVKRKPAGKNKIAKVMKSSQRKKK
jgi:hypothetical protein